MNYFDVQENFSERDGTLVELAKGNKFSGTQVQGFGSFAFQAAHRLTLGGSVSQSQSQNQGLQRTNSEFSDSFMDYEYDWRLASLQTISKLGVVVPFTRVNPKSDRTLTHEGALKFETGQWLVWQWDMVTMFGYVGARYEDEGRGVFLPYQLGAEFPMHSWKLGGFFDGQGVLLDDEQSTSTEKKRNVTDRVNAGSYKFFSVNPVVFRVNGFAAFRLGTTWISLQLGQAFAGKSYAKETTIQAQLVFALPSVFGGEGDGAVSPKSELFEEEQSPYDASLFKRQKIKAKPKKKK